MEVLQLQNALLQKQIEVFRAKESDSKALMQEAGKRWEACLAENERLKSASANP
jgi:hypothetical protein